MKDTGLGRIEHDFAWFLSNVRHWPKTLISLNGIGWNEQVSIDTVHGSEWKIIEIFQVLLKVFLIWIARIHDSVDVIVVKVEDIVYAEISVDLSVSHAWPRGMCWEFALGDWNSVEFEHIWCELTLKLYLNVLWRTEPFLKFQRIKLISPSSCIPMTAITLSQGNVDSLSIRSKVFPKLHCDLKISWTWIQIDTFQSNSKKITFIKCCRVISRILLGKPWYREADLLLVQSVDECIGEDAYEV